MYFEEGLSTMTPALLPSPEPLRPTFVQATGWWPIARCMLSAALAAGGLAAVGATAAIAADATTGSGVVMMALPAKPAAVRAYWTPERMRNARSLDLPQTSTTPVPLADLSPDLPAAAVTTVAGAGKPPSLAVKPDLENRLFEPDPTAEAGVDSGAVEPQNAGSRGAHFSSSRVFPDGATTAYPYRTVGKIFFTKPGEGDFICSGAVQRPRVVTTAGHCVHSGNGNPNAYYTNFVFIPSYRAGIAPYGSWTPVFVITTATWINGGGAVPNGADYALFQMADLNGRRIGDVTGYLGYATGKLRPNHAHLLGYPGNLDSGERMHQVTAQSFAADTNGAVIYGSDMRGGSSGGPWVQNFGVPSAGQTGGVNAQLNTIIGVTSYGPTAVGPFYQGSSTMDSRFVTMLNTVCGRRTGNC